MDTDRIPIEIRRDVLQPLGLQSVETLPPGMSGAAVFRCLLDSGSVRLLKQWPTGTSAARVAEVGRVIEHARSNGCQLVPHSYAIAASGATCRVIADHCWQLMDWMPGQPLATDCGLDSIESGAAAIASFHASTISLGSQRQVHAGAVVARLERARELKPLIAQIGAMDPATVLSGIPTELTAALYEARQLVLGNWETVSTRISAILNVYAAESLHTQYVLRDIHRENALFIEGLPSGLIDFDAIRVDTPWTDLARWAGSFLGGSHPPSSVWDAATSGFCRNHPLNVGHEVEFGRNLAQRLSLATIWIGLANWLVWLLIEHRDFGTTPDRIAARIGQLHQAAVAEL